MHVKIGQVVRIDEGSTALMRVITRRVVGGRYRYYGKQCMGGGAGVYHDNVQKASTKDLKTWRECKEWRRL